MKIIINKCFGGFGLSEEAMYRYAELKGLTLYPEKGKPSLFTTYWTVPEDARPKEIDWAKSSQKERAAYNESYRNSVLYDRDISRTDPDLIKTVEELGSAADGRCAELAIVEIPDDVEYTIEEYDGSEHIAETHRTWY